MGSKGLFDCLQGWKIIQDGFKTSAVDVRSVIECLLGPFIGILDKQLLCFTMSEILYHPLRREAFYSVLNTH